MKRNKTMKITKVSAFLLLLYVLSACTDESMDKDSTGGGGHTVTLRLAATVSPIQETKATVRAARPGSEAAAAGFSYELVSSETDTTAPLATKAAPTTLKNVYALLFTSTGAYNGYAHVNTVTSSEAVDITFGGVTDANAKDCRLVIVANDNSAANPYSSSTNFETFRGTYTEFQALTMTNNIDIDADVPYAGTVIGVNVAEGRPSDNITVYVYRTLAKIIINNSFNITDGPACKSITLYGGGERRFAPEGENTYHGAGNDVSTVIEQPPVNEKLGSVESATFYVGENIRPAGSSIITTPADRNRIHAPAGASYIQIASEETSGGITNPKIGEEYGGKIFTYDIYLGDGTLKDFSLRRNTNYTINSTVRGSLLMQESLADADGRVSRIGVGLGLVIGKFGGFKTSADGENAISGGRIKGEYSKLLVLQANIKDQVEKIWANSKIEQPYIRRYWDHTYALGLIEKTSGSAYNYCYELTLGGVNPGTWYLPSQAQVQAIWTVLAGLKEDRRYDRYTEFYSSYYWSCSGGSSGSSGTDNVWSLHFGSGYMVGNSQSSPQYVRCVRDYSDT